MLSTLTDALSGEDAKIYAEPSFDATRDGLVQGLSLVTARQTFRHQATPRQPAPLYTDGPSHTRECFQWSR